MKNFVYLFALVLCLAACDTATSTTEKPAEKATATTPAAPQGKQMPSIPLEDVQHIFEKCDYIDYVFYNTNFSISQNEKASIQSAISHISQTPATLNPACKPIGRIFYQIEAVNVLEADMYFQDGCAYYVFLKNNKPTYGNLMTQDGIGYMNNIIQRASTVQPQ